MDRLLTKIAAITNPTPHHNHRFPSALCCQTSRMEIQILRRNASITDLSLWLKDLPNVKAIMSHEVKARLIESTRERVINSQKIQEFELVHKQSYSLIAELLC